MIDSYSFGTIVINGKKYSSDVIIYPSRIDSKWWRREGHSLYLEDIEEILRQDPDILIIGTGAYGAMNVPEKVREKIRELGIELIIDKTPSAVKTYNELISSKEIIAALHLTC